MKLVTFNLICMLLFQPFISHAFSLNDVDQKAKVLAEQPYQEPVQDLTKELADLDYDEYRQIRFKSDHALWRDQKLPFQIEFFHRGFYYKNKVEVNEIDNLSIKRLDYSRDLFDLGSTKLKPFSEDLGFAGFRVKYHFSKEADPLREVSVFLGASYFRLAGLHQRFGLSARALAIDTGLNKPEEFPVFHEFWLQKPGVNDTSLTFYGLLDSPSVTGAYQFILYPGEDPVLEVQSHLYTRKSIEVLGIAPITSMYYVGKNVDHLVDDYRPEVHDSDGLAVNKSTGDWLWRPLINPAQLSWSIIQDPAVQGYGLLQRERHFMAYQDYSEDFEHRPSLWVKPLENWGAGSVNLVEIPSAAEKYDNIAAFWRSDTPIKANMSLSFHYQLSFLLSSPSDSLLATVEATRIGAGGSGGLDHINRRFVVDFDKAHMHIPLTDIKPVIHTSVGDIEHVNILESPNKHNWRLVFELNPQGNPGPIELMAFLTTEHKKLSETWLYQWHQR